MEPGPPAGECGVLTTGAPGSCQCSITSTSHALEATQMRIRKLTQTSRWAKGRSTGNESGCTQQGVSDNTDSETETRGCRVYDRQRHRQKNPQCLQAKENPGEDDNGLKKAQGPPESMELPVSHSRAQSSHAPLQIRSLGKHRNDKLQHRADPLSAQQVHLTAQLGSPGSFLAAITVGTHSLSPGPQPPTCQRSNEYPRLLSHTTSLKLNLINGKRS